MFWQVLSQAQHVGILDCGYSDHTQCIFDEFKLAAYYYIIDRFVVIDEPAIVIEVDNVNDHL